MEENLENKPVTPEETPAEQLQTDAETQPAEDIALSDAMTGVYSEPAETFKAVKNSKKRSYWVVPTILLIVISLVASFLVINDEELYSEIKTMQFKAAKERLEESVKDGKMSQEQMDQSMEQMEKFMDKSSPFFLISAILGPIIGGFVILFFRGLVLWGVLKIFKGAASYMLVICALGLASMIDMISTVINTVLAIVMGKLTVNIGPALFITNDMVGESMAKFLGHFDLIAIWYLIVLGIGLGAVSNLKSSKTIPVVFALWLIWIIAVSFLNIPFTGR
jgi:hypothetical protein